MKKQLFLFSVLLYVLSGLAVAQTSVVAQSPNTSETKKVLIIENKYPSTISCANTGKDSVIFIYSDASMQSWELIISGYYVNDIARVKDTLFFCGRTTDGNQRRGIIGYFKFDDRFLNVDSVRIYNDFLVGEGALQVNEFTRMISYLSSMGDRHVLCLGNCYDSMYPCMVDMYNFMGSGWAYSGGMINNDKETLTDIRFVSTYMGLSKNLVTSGFDESYGKFINIRVYDPDNVFDPWGTQNMSYNFCVEPYGSLEFEGSEVLLSDVGNGIFSTASYRKRPVLKDGDEGIPRNKTSLDVAFYNLSTILANSVYGMTQHYGVQLPTNIDKHIDEYILKTNTKTLGLLHTITPLSGSIESHFCEIYYPSLPSSTAIKAYSYYDNILQDMSLYNGNTQYVMSGYSLSDNTYLKYEMESFGGSHLCANDMKYSLFESPTLSSINQEKPFTSMIGPVIWKTVEHARRNVPVYIECEDGQTKSNE